MVEIRQRKLKDHEEDLKDNKHPHRSKRQEKKWFRRSVTISCVIIIILVAIYSSLLNSILKSLFPRPEGPVFAVIIDAGSTGSRVLAYTFNVTDGELDLIDELFHEVKPGLSSYVDHPEKGAQSILTLINYAYKVVPSHARSDTPLIVRATAGLRLLDANAADALLEAVRQAMKTTGFLVAEDGVEIMDGQAEGIYSWFTANFLQERMKGPTAAALDLGGGSTQVTYEPSLNAPSNLVVMPGPNRSISLYTHSYLNLGLMAVRYGVLMEENDENSPEIQSKCVNPVVKKQKWRYKNKDYYVSGSQNDVKYVDTAETDLNIAIHTPIVDVEHCKGLIHKVVKRLLQDIPVPTHIGEQHINAFSYFTDAAIDAGLIGDPTAGGKIKVSDYIDASHYECTSANVDQPWICLDLTYMAILLQEAYKLPPHKEIELLKKIKGHEVSWALGLAYNTLTQNNK